jgi:hypothetical protein
MSIVVILQIRVIQQPARKRRRNSLPPAMENEVLIKALFIVLVLFKVK